MRLFCTALFLLGFIGIAYGAEVVLVQTAPGTFRLEGRSFSGVAAADVTLSFDPSRLRDLRVVQGDLASGGLFVANPLPEGRVRIALIHPRPLARSGTLALLTGTPAGSAGAPFTSLSASLKGEDGGALPVRTLLPAAPVPTPPSAPAPAPVRAPAPGPAPAPPEATAPGEAPPLSLPAAGKKNDLPRLIASSPAVFSQTPPAGSSPSFPDLSTGAWPSEPPPSPMPAPSTRGVPAGAGEPKAESGTRNFLPLFREGSMTFDDKIRLLREPLGEGVRQEPMPAVADGKNPVRVYLDGLSQEGPPNAALTNAQIQGIYRASSGWEIDLLPEGGASEGTLLVLGRDEVRTVHLAIAPPVTIDIDGNPGVTAADLALFRSERSRFDLDGNGRRDGVDDYIFLVNYLAAGGKGRPTPNGD